MRKAGAFLAAAAFAFLAFAAPGPIATFRDWKRVSAAPVLAPRGSGWEGAGTFNPAVIARGGRFVMLYRAQDAAGTSRLGYAESADGIRFTRRGEPVLSPEADYEKDGGVEDPRLVRIGGSYYLTYTGYNKRDAQLCLAESKDLVRWKRLGIILPAYKGNWNRGWTKSGAILSEKIAGKYWMYWLGTDREKTDEMGLSSSADLVHWQEETAAPVLPRRRGRFDSRVVEPGPPPVVTPKGIVLVYNGADDNLVYRTGIAVFDARDPRKVLYRSEEPVFAPELSWEQDGQVPNVVFIEGMARKGSDWLFYYGGADKYVGVAAARLDLTSRPD